jgi:hypothetical protein
MKVLIFSGRSIDSIQRNMNESLKDINRIIEVKQSYSDHTLIITIIYE